MGGKFVATLHVWIWLDSLHLHNYIIDNLADNKFLGRISFTFCILKALLCCLLVFFVEVWCHFDSWAFMWGLGFLSLETYRIYFVLQHSKISWLQILVGFILFIWLDNTGAQQPRNSYNGSSWEIFIHSDLDDIHSRFPLSTSYVWF